MARESTARSLGKYEAADLVASSWLQGLSRAGSPQLHTHNQWTRMCFTRSDGKGRAMDTMALRAQLSGVNAIVAAYTEAALTREFGLSWRARADGLGNEIEGVTDAECKLFSERTADINKMTQRLAREWEQRNGRPPTEYELLHIQKKATMRTRAGKEDGSIDWDLKTDDWDRRLVEALGERLSDIARRVLPGDGQSDATEHGGPPSPEKQRQAIQDAVEILGSKRSTWTRAEFMRTLQTVLPPEVALMDPADAAALVDGLAEEATSGRGG